MKNIIKNIKNEIENKVKSVNTFKASLFSKINIFQNKVKSLQVTKNKSLGDISDSIFANLRKYSMFYVLLVILIFFFSWTDGLITQPNTIVDILEANSYILIISMGMLLVIIAGYIDLSVGSLLGFSGALSVVAYNGIANHNMFATIVIMLIFGLSAGFAQGFLVGYLKIPSFIVTLGGMLIFQGLLQHITKGSSIWPKGSDSSSYITSITNSMPDIIVGGLHIFTLIIFIVAIIFVWIFAIYGRFSKQKYEIKVNSWIIFIVKMIIMTVIILGFGLSISASIYGLKYYILAILIIFIIFSIITNLTIFGRRVYAIGGNKNSASLSGINVAKISTYVFMINGAITAFAGIVFTAIMGAATASAGQGFELDVISAVFVGGASMAGGLGTITGTIIGSFILGIINKGMDIQSLGTDYQRIIKGLVLLMAVGYDVYSNRKLR